MDLKELGILSKEYLEKIVTITKRDDLILKEVALFQKLNGKAHVHIMASYFNKDDGREMFWGCVVPLVDGDSCE